MRYMYIASLDTFPLALGGTSLSVFTSTVKFRAAPQLGMNAAQIEQISVRQHIN